MTSCSSVALVHAFADVAYHRSSFHFAGSSDSVLKVVSALAIDTFESIPSFSFEKSSTATVHPSVGLIDHISLMPLINQTVSEDITLAAMGIGRIMEEKLPVDIFFYGKADKENEMSLAQVRKLRTNFFSLSNQSDTNNDHYTSQRSIACIGCPVEFTENFNVRLAFPCEMSSDAKRIASTLSKSLRERDGGIAGVEALTLKYHCDDSNIVMYEAACNLLKPQIGTTDDIIRKTNEWMDKVGSKYGVILDDAYRVGTTKDQCMEILSLSMDEQREHHKDVFSNFVNYFRS